MAFYVVSALQIFSFFKRYVIQDEKKMKMEK